MIQFETVGGKRKMVVSSRTPSKSEHPYMNRWQRRRLIYASPIERLMVKIDDLRSFMIQMGVKKVTPPRFMNKKYLSGYMSRLVMQARNS